MSHTHPHCASEINNPYLAKEEEGTLFALIIRLVLWFEGRASISEGILFQKKKLLHFHTHNYSSSHLEVARNEAGKLREVYENCMYCKKVILYS